MVTLAFTLRDDERLHKMSEEGLATEIRRLVEGDPFEEDQLGIAMWGFTEVLALMAKEI
tara:strand:- start:5614 stop:5790 length:177 start_codon:yes stop_codon:yes gene_type:complete